MITIKKYSSQLALLAMRIFKIEIIVRVQIKRIFVLWIFKDIFIKGTRPLAN